MGKINPNEAPEGYVAVSSYLGCGRCDFYIQGQCTNTAADCLPCERDDGCNVNLIKKMATASWPYDSEGTPV